MRQHFRPWMAIFSRGIRPWRRGAVICLGVVVMAFGLTGGMSWAQPDLTEAEQDLMRRMSGQGGAEQVQDAARGQRDDRARQEAERRREERREAALRRAEELRSQRAQEASSQPRAERRSAQPAPVQRAERPSRGTHHSGLDRWENRGLATFSFDPPLHYSNVGDVFNIDLRLENPSGEPYDALGATVLFDTRYLRVVAPMGSRVEDFKPGEGSVRMNRGPESGYVNYVDNENGRIRLAGYLEDSGVRSVGGVVYSVSFEAVSPTSLGRDTELRFDYGEQLAMDRRYNPRAHEALGKGTFLGRQGEDRLGDPDLDEDGGIIANIEISDVKGTVKDGEIFRPVAVQGENNTRYVVRPRPPVHGGPFRVGDEIDVDIILENPDAIEFNHVSLFLAYNTRVLEPVDHNQWEDENGDVHGNWIQHGINILDGPYQQTFPFNLFVENQVRPEKGLILYEAGNQQALLTSQGVVATCRFIAVAPTTHTRLKSFFNREGKTPTTGLFLYNIDVLGSSEDHTDGVYSIPFAVMPGPAGDEMASVP